MNLYSTHEEDCRTFTDRWGNLLSDMTVSDSPEGCAEPTAEQMPVVETLAPMMYSDITFIAERGGKMGILFEVEYDDGHEPLLADADALLAISVQFPVAQVWFTKGAHTFGERYVARVFLPSDVATVAISEAIGEALSKTIPAPLPTPAEPIVTIPLSVATQIYGDCEAHLEDWESGMQDGTYDADDPAKKRYAESEAALAAMQSAITAAK